MLMTADASAQLDEHVDQTPCILCEIMYFESNVLWFECNVNSGLVTSVLAWGVKSSTPVPTLNRYLSLTLSVSKNFCLIFVLVYFWLIGLNLP